MNTVVVKFGGSSLADAAQFRKVAAIIQSNPARRYVVASAPGKRFSEDIKVTDLLYQCHQAAASGQDFMPVLNQIRTRFSDIIRDLEISFDLDSEFQTIQAHLESDPQRDYMASRGEYLNSKVLAAFMGRPFVDPADFIRFHADGSFDAERTDTDLGAALQTLDTAVVAGFYGALPDGTIHTFSRGGSDVTGAIVAAAVRADMYENWTDVSGMLVTDPRVVDHPQVIDYISYRELRELSYMGASVLHEDAVFPVRKVGIPINIRNTNRPEDNGTIITCERPSGQKARSVTGIAGRKGFSSVHVEKSMMNAEVGFGSGLLQVFASHGIPFEHCPSGIDTMSVIVNTDELAPHREEILQEIRDRFQPDMLVVEDNLALLAVVSPGMPYSKGIAAPIFAALVQAGVVIRMIDQGSSKLNIILGVAEEDYETAVRSIYDAVMS